MQPASPSPGPRVPPVADVVQDLRQVVKVGLRDIGDSSLRTLPSLASIQAAADGKDAVQVGIAIEAVVGDSVERLGDGYLGSVLQALFGLDDATRGRNAKQRRRMAAQRAESSGSTFVRHDESRVLRSLAVEVLRADADFRRRAERAGWANRPLTPEQRQARWDDRFGYYHRLRTAAINLRHHVIAAVTALTIDTDETSRVDYIHSSLYWFARFLAEQDCFDRSNLGGRWILPTPDADMDAESAAYQVRWLSPYNERGESLLRVTMANVSSELWSWISRLESSPEGTEILGMWHAWLMKCHGDLDACDDSCLIRGMVDQAERLAETVEREWRLLIDSDR